MFSELEGYIKHHATVKVPNLSSHSMRGRWYSTLVLGPRSTKTSLKSQGRMSKLRLPRPKNTANPRILRLNTVTRDSVQRFRL
ncbi:hypothetical protein PsorP6_014593 [Peronosclerospora sorghi]|uniref:Uncharacterized protein n=1 Tax=Peronosclerospora sorghi TaxID=230839 RepID=A0ACC0VRF8_9STRA|nr:hypothetical protein PsorP6_014593 [Peronosclerospora sorghi]